ncbi:unnamed protein product [Brassicogethes aeneus]|uniref:Gag-like protein n=1 Tax=Brassicogethes aeneus TaxID=1431903 RepID=A0A9P0B3Y0_BRAAE|nr:unnamed protein product [Brassicogethes aeneus]
MSDHPKTPIMPAEIPSLGLFYPDNGAPGFQKSQKIVRTPVKGERPLIQPSKLDKEKDKKPKKKKSSKSGDDSNVTGNSKSSISPNIISKIDQLYHSTHESHPRTENPDKECLETYRLQRENARLIDMVESLTAQLSNQAAQIDSLQKQLELLNANFTALQNKDHSNSTNAHDSSPTGQNHASKRKRTTPSSPESKEATEPMDNEPIEQQPSTHNSPAPDRDFPALPSQSGKSYEPPVSRPPPTTFKPKSITNEPSTGEYLPPTQQSSKSPDPTPIPIKQDKIPPIILRKKSRWTMVSSAISKLNLKFSKATNTQDGVKFFPCSSDDYRGITRFLSENGEEYHTYMLPEEKTVQVVIRGLPLEIDIADIKQDLLDHQYHPTIVTRMRRGQEKTVMPLVLVKVPPDEDRIFNLEWIRNMSHDLWSNYPKLRHTKEFLKGRSPKFTENLLRRSTEGSDHGPLQS